MLETVIYDTKTNNDILAFFKTNGVIFRAFLSYVHTLGFPRVAIALAEALPNVIALTPLGSLLML
ncbi:MAG: hypothetical protein DRJ05_09770 [Bacteroidetes bacterium]|nr:MAG: hypothetical protein DRJ05_09770 [Bacteroidota bacterium]